MLFTVCFTQNFTFIEDNYNNQIDELDEFTYLFLMQYCYCSRKAMSVPHGSEQKTENASDRTEDWLHNARKQLIPNKVDWSVCITLFRLFTFLMNLKTFQCLITDRDNLMPCVYYVLLQCHIIVLYKVYGYIYLNMITFLHQQ